MAKIVWPACGDAALAFVARWSMASRTLARAASESSRARSWRHTPPPSRVFWMERSTTAWIFGSMPSARARAFWSSSSISSSIASRVAFSRLRVISAG